MCVRVMEVGGIPYVACTVGKWVTLLGEDRPERIRETGSAGLTASQVTSYRLLTAPTRNEVHYKCI